MKLSGMKIGIYCIELQRNKAEQMESNVSSSNFFVHLRVLRGEMIADGALQRINVELVWDDRAESGKGGPLRAALPTPPDMRVRIRRFNEGGQAMPRESSG